MIKYILTIFFLAIYGLDALALNFVFQISKSVYIQEDFLPIFLKKNIQPDLYIYLEISDLESKILQKEYIKLENDQKSFLCKLDADIKKGTYIVSAYLLGNDGLTIIENHQKSIHVIDENTNINEFYVFENGAVQANPKIVKSIKVNEALNIDNSMAFGIDSRLAKVTDIKVIFPLGNTLLPDNSFRLFYSSNTLESEIQNYLALNSENKKTEKVNYVESISGFSHRFYNSQDANKFLIFDSRNLKEVERPTAFNFDLSPTEKLKKISFEVNIKELYKELLMNKKLNEYYEIQHQPLYKEIKDNIVSDNEYLMSNYTSFENVNTFFKEVVFPLKRNNKEIFLLSGVNKKWNVAKAVLIIDDHIVEDHSKIDNLDWSQLESIRLYRRIETFRQSYGSLGRNGIIEITTKNRVVTKNNNKLYMSEALTSKDHKAISSDTYFIPTATNHNRIGNYQIFDWSGKDQGLVQIIE